MIHYKKNFIFIYILCTWIFNTSCNQLESDNSSINLDQIAQTWILESGLYSRNNESYEYLPYEDILLRLFKGGRFSVDDRFQLLGFRPKNGTGIASEDIQLTYGSWELTNEAKADKIVFNKGINTYNLNEIRNVFKQYALTNPEFLFQISYDTQRMRLKTNDPYLVYYYAFWLYYDDAFAFDYISSDSSDYTTDRAQSTGRYFGYAFGYRDGAKEAANSILTTEIEKAYLNDPYNVGYAHGIVEFYTRRLAGKDSLLPPAFLSTFDQNFDQSYTLGYNEALEKVKARLASGLFTLTFLKR